MDFFSLLSPDALEEMLMSHPWHFVGWSALVLVVGFKAGYRYGRYKSGILTYYDLTKRQRSILASLRDGDSDSSTLRCDGHVRDLVAQGLIACADGYDLDDRAETYEFILTSKGDRMLNCHPIASMVAKRRANNG